MFAWTVLLGEWLIRLIMLVVVVRRKSPTTALAWLTVIFFQPWLGLGLYLLLGENRLGRRRRRRHRQVLRAIETVDRLSIQDPHIVQPSLPPEQQSFVRLTENLGAMAILGGNAVTLMADTERVISQLIDDIDRAEHHVHLLFYIFRDDTVGRRVAEALARAEQRGVQCRLLVDAVGSRRMLRRMTRWLTERGIQVYGLLPANLWRRPLARLDLRNHRKLAVIDGHIAYAGSQNIVEAHYGHRDLAWNDMMVRLTGPTVLQLQLVFLEDWYFQTDEVLDTPDILPEPQQTGEVAMQVVPSGPAYPTEPLLNVIVEAIHVARDRLIITSPYLIPDTASLLALQLAVRRGVQVDLVVPERSDHPLVAAAARAYYQDLLEMGVRVYRFQPGLLHAKTMTIDDTVAMIGSANFDIRSFFLNFELNLLMYGAQVTAQLRFAQNDYIRQSRPLDRAAWSDRPALPRFLDDTAKLLSPLL
jgi:cardiolipin synthase